MYARFYYLHNTISYNNTYSLSSSMSRPFFMPTYLLVSPSFGVGMITVQPYLSLTVYKSLYSD